MGSGKLIVFVIVCGALVGCASMKPGHTNDSKDSIYEEGYRKGVAENINSMVEKLNGNDFPYLGGTWAEPITQEVRIPAHVQGGIFYPEHNELVIITPGEWKRNNPFPIKADQKDFRKSEDSIDTVTAPVTDITAMPNQFGPKGTASAIKGGE